MINSNVIISNLHRSYLTVFPQGATVTPRAHGIDVSKYDLYFEPATAQGQLDFVIQRISYRLTQDEAFDQLVDGVHEVPIRGGYHYLNSGTDWRAQADKFLAIIAGYDYHFAACDFEDAYNVLSTAFAYDAWKWIHYVQDRTGKPAFLYTSPNLYKLYITPSQAVYGIDWNTVALWTAQWFFTPNPNENPTLPAGRTSWRLWQYTDQGNGPLYGVARPTACDLDVFNGTPQQMREFLNIGDVAPPPSGGTMALYEGTAKLTSTPYTRVRKPNPDGSLNADGMTIGQINPGQTFKADAKAQDSMLRDWLHITEVGGKPINGWSAAWLLDYHEVTVPTDPVVTLPDLSYTVTIDGGLAYESATITGVIKARQ